MSQENGIPKIEADLDHIIQVKLPVVRDFSTGGGHAPGPDLMEGRGPDAGIVTKKWQGWAPENLNVVGKPLPPMPPLAPKSPPNTPMTPPTKTRAGPRPSPK